MSNPTFSPTDLRQLQRDLATWRRQQTERVRLPEAVWLSATRLAQRHGASLVARTLHLDYPFALRSMIMLNEKIVPFPAVVGPPTFKAA